MLVALQHVLVAFCHVKIQPWEFEKTVVGRRSMAWAQKLQDRCVECLWMNKTEISYIICKYNIYIYIYIYIYLYVIFVYTYFIWYVSMSSHLLSSWYVLICIDMNWYVRQRKWQVRELESLVQQRHPQLAPQPQSAPPVRSPMGEAKFAGLFFSKPSKIHEAWMTGRWRCGLSMIIYW